MAFDYNRNYRRLDLRESPHLYRVGRGEQGVLLVEPYKSEILPVWKFKTSKVAARSAADIRRLYFSYRKNGDFIGMDMARKFLQMGYTRSRRYANHRSGRKYGKTGSILPLAQDREKARAAQIFLSAWKSVENDPIYLRLRKIWKEKLG